MPLRYFKHLIIALILVVLTSGYNTYAQKVGIVLSGGGSSGLAHIGFIRALEEQEIPIDYISGTSMGALVGAMYAAGYTTEEMEELFKSDEFRLWSKGKINERFTHYFKQNVNDASWIKLKIDLDSMLEKNLPTNIINSTSLDFGLAELFAPSSANAHNDFDNLFVPFRCLASDITSKKSVVFKEGDLSTAVRASITYPFYLNPVNIDGKLLYDGGLYDNFPVSTLCSEFEPDFIIGNNVSYNFPEPQEDNVLSQIRSMMSHDTEYEINCEKGFIVEPKVPDLSLLDFSRVSELVDIGYRAALAKTDSIKRYVTVRRSEESLKEERRIFNEKKPKLEIREIKVEGLTKSETKYVLKSLRAGKNGDLSFHELESKIFRLASDEKILRIDPDLIYSDSLDGFILKLKVKKEKSFFVSFGGNISNMNANEGFIALQYNNLSVTPFTAYSNAYFGRFYTSAHVLGKIEFPMALPFQINGSFTFNKWDYFQNSSFLIDETAPSYLIQRENYARASLTFPFSYKGKVDIGANMGRIEYEYYLDNEFTRFDTADITKFTNTTFYGKYERNSLNRKQYANKGNYLCLKASYVDGTEKTSPGGSTSNLHDTTLNHSWYSLKFHLDQYFNAGRKFKYGAMLEGVYSDQPFFSNYAATLLSSPGFEPIPESKTIFRSKFRAHQYGAIGLRTIYTPIKNFDLRLEGFMFQPIKEIVLSQDNGLKYEDVIQNRYFIGSFTMVYDFNLTQIAVNVNYYDNFNEEFPRNKAENYTIMLHLGFLIFNESMQK